MTSTRAARRGPRHLGSNNRGQKALRDDARRLAEGTGDQRQRQHDQIEIRQLRLPWDRSSGLPPEREILSG